MEKINAFSISEIKPIKFIQLYQIDGYYEVKVMYGDKTLVVNYTNPKFKELLLYLYQEAQTNDDITIFGKFDEEEIKKALRVSIEVDTFEEKESIFDIDRDAFLYKFIVWEAIQEIIKNLKDNTNLELINTYSKKNKLTFVYKINNERKQIVTNYSRKNNEINFKLSYIEEDVLPVNIKIKHLDSSLNVTWTTPLKEFSSSKTYLLPSIDNNNFTNDYDLVDDNNVNKYLDMLGFDDLKVTDVAPNTYIFFNMDDNTIISGILTIDKETAIIKFNIKVGSTYYGENDFISSETYQEEDIIKKEGNQYTVERKLLPSEKMTYESGKNIYKHHIGGKHV